MATENEEQGTSPVTEPNRSIVSEIADSTGKIYDIAAKRFANNVTVELTGAVTGKVEQWNGKDALTVATTIPDASVAGAKLVNGAVGTTQIADDAVTLDKIADSAIGTAISANDNLLATQKNVKTYVDNMVTGSGSYLGKKSVTEINALDITKLYTGDHIIVTDAGTITNGTGSAALTVRASEDIILWKTDDTTWEWQTMDGEFKLKGTEFENTIAATKVITKIKQDSDGNLTYETSDITSASGTAAGIAKLYTATGDNEDGSITQKGITTELGKKQDSLTFDGTYDSSTNKVATVSSITSRISGFYTKPAAGIPSTDMTEAVQTSLGKADSALQSSDVKSTYSGTGTDPINGTAVKAAIDGLDAEITSTDGTNVQVKVTEVDGKITAVNVTTDNTYAKPAGGIPSTDLAEAVQTSLGKADTALQSYTETDPVFTASAASGIKTTDISAWNAKYDKPATGIPSTDLADAVQTSLGKADTALQSSDVKSTYSGTGTDPVNGTAVKAAIDGLDAEITSTDGTNVQVKVTEVDGKITAVNVTTDNTAKASDLADKQDALQVEYDADNTRLTFKNVAFTTKA